MVILPVYTFDSCGCGGRDGSGGGDGVGIVEAGLW